jgi:hypothetical protein
MNPFRTLVVAAAAAIAFIVGSAGPAVADSTVGTTTQGQPGATLSVDDTPGAGPMITHDS